MGEADDTQMVRLPKAPFQDDLVKVSLPLDGRDALTLRADD